MLIIKKSKGFTLVEVLLYFGLFALIIAITYPIFVSVLGNYLNFKSHVDISAEIRNVFLAVQKEIFKSNSIDILTDWEIVFNQKNNNFSAIFQTKPVYLSNNKLNGYASNLSVGSISFNGDLYGVSYIPVSNCTISSSNNIPALYSFSGYAWSPNIGWIKFRNTEANEPIYGVCEDTNKEIRGFAWNDAIGYISFNCADLGVCGSSNYKVIEKENYLYGYAWNEVIGWIIFDGRGGKVYLAKLDPFIKSINLISDPRVFVDDLKFSRVGETLKVNLKIKGPGNSYEESESAIALPFK